MKKLAVLIIAASALLSGCVAYEVQDRDGGARHADRGRDGPYGRMDRERERDDDRGPNREDRRRD